MRPPGPRNFREVNLGLTYQLAMLEAERCLQCPKPYCIDGCPVAVNIPQFIKLLREGDLPGAARVAPGRQRPALRDRAGLPAGEPVRGGLPAGQEGQVRRHRQPRALRRRLGDAAPATRCRLTTRRRTGSRVAIVGSGPAGLTAAGELAKRGYDVTIFEAFHAPGGVLIYGIPEFRLPKDIVQAEVDRLVDAGVKIEANAIIGKTFTLPELRERFDAIFVAVGAGLPVFMNVPGENYKGVYSANEYLTRVNLMGAWQDASDTPVLHGQRVVVVGGGNVAMDAVRTSRRLGAAEATIVYRRSHDELPGPGGGGPPRRAGGRPVRVPRRPARGPRRRDALGDRASAASGWSSASPTPPAGAGPSRSPGSEFEIPCDMVVVAIGTRSNPLLTATAPELDVNDVGLHRHRRVRDDEHARRLRRRRHRPRRGDGHPRDGRRQAVRSLDRRLAPRRMAAHPARAARAARPTGEGRDPRLTAGPPRAACRAACRAASRGASIHPARVAARASIRPKSQREPAAGRSRGASTDPALSPLRYEPTWHEIEIPPVSHSDSNPGGTCARFGLDRALEPPPGLSRTTPIHA